MPNLIAWLPCEYCHRDTPWDLSTAVMPCCKKCRWIPATVGTVGMVAFVAALIYIIYGGW